MPTILMTGAAGHIGAMLRTQLAASRPHAATPRCGAADRRARRGSHPGIDHRPGGADRRLRRGRRRDSPGRPGGRGALGPIAEVNIHGTYVVFEAARRAGVSRVVFASSNHAVGFTPAADFPVADYAFPLPDTYYGVSKVAGEALAALYHNRYGMDAICLRILSCTDRARTIRELSTWLSPDDTGRLFEACLTAEKPGFRVAYGVSANTRGGWVSLDEARALATSRSTTPSSFAAEVIAASGEPDPADPVQAYLGGEFCLPSSTPSSCHDRARHRGGKQRLPAAHARAVGTRRDQPVPDHDHRAGKRWRERAGFQLGRASWGAGSPGHGRRGLRPVRHRRPGRARGGLGPDVVAAARGRRRCHHAGDGRGRHRPVGPAGEGRRAEPDRPDRPSAGPGAGLRQRGEPAPGAGRAHRAGDRLGRGRPHQGQDQGRAAQPG